MNTIGEKSTTNPFDGVKWAIAILLLLGIVTGNYLYSEQIHIVLRVSIFIAMGVLALFVAAFTTKGKIFIEFAKDARLEVRKVVWPTRQETVQTTLIIVAVSTVIGLVLWGLDGIFVRLVEFITMAI